MAIDPAMLVYLSNAENVKGSPNQNFARELMELFTLGVGNYTEDDVEAAARAWTGHNADWPEYVYQFKPEPARHRQQDVLRHDQELGRPGDHHRDPGQQPDEAADRGAVHRQEAVGVPGPPGPAGRRARCAGAGVRGRHEHLTNLVRGDPEPARVLRTAAKQGLVRTPIECIVALCYYTGIDAEDLGVAWRAETAGQQMYQPPNVAGWKPNALLAQHQRAWRPRRLRPLDDMVAARRRRVHSTTAM